MSLTSLVACLCLTGDSAQDLSRETWLRGIDASGKGISVEARQRTGWETIRGFSWVIERQDPAQPGVFHDVDATQTFHHGQKFRLRIKAYCDLYVYVLVRNADGSQCFLLPQALEEVPRIEKDKTCWLPAQGPPFRFSPPAGEEQLRLIVSPEQLPWVTSREMFLLQHGQRLDAQEQATVERFKRLQAKSLNDTMERQTKLPQVTSLDQAASDISAGRMTRGCEVLAIDRTGAETFVMSASGDRNSRTITVCDITLRHQP